MTGTSSSTLLLGAVAYDPKVVTIWTGFRAWFSSQGFPFDYILYSHYEHQVTDLIAGRIHVAWNSPLAWVRARRLAQARGEQVWPLVMRDTDRDLTSVVVVRADSPIKAPADLVDRFGQLLLGMAYANPTLRPLLDLEGLKAWCEGRTDGYQPLERAVERLGFYDALGNVTAHDYRP